MVFTHAHLFLALLALSEGLRSVKDTQKQLASAKAQLQQLDSKVYSSLMANTGCDRAPPKVAVLAAKANAVKRSKSGGDRCEELCKGKGGCMEVCNEVKSMICDAPTMQTMAISSDNSAAAAAAAAAAATSAVRDAVKDAIQEAQDSSKQAAHEAHEAVKAAVAEAGRVAKLAAKDAASQAAKAAAEAAAKEAAMSAHAIASTAAAAATAAARTAGMAAAPAAGKAAAPAPAGF